METFNLSKKKPPKSKCCGFSSNRMQYRKETGRMINWFHLKPYEPFISATQCSPVIHVHLHLQQLHSCIFWLLIRLHLMVLLKGGWEDFFFVWPFWCEGLTWSSTTTPTWEFHRSRVMGEAPPQQTYQECTNQRGKKEEVEVVSSKGNTGLHCSPTFTFHSSPLSVFQSHPSTKDEPSISYVWLLFHSFLSHLLRLLHNHLTWHFPTATNDVLTESFNALSACCQWEGN